MSTSSFGSTSAPSASRNAADAPAGAPSRLGGPAGPRAGTTGSSPSSRREARAICTILASVGREILSAERCQMDEMLRKAALDYHRLPKPGQSGIGPTKGTDDQRD